MRYASAATASGCNPNCGSFFKWINLLCELTFSSDPEEANYGTVVLRHSIRLRLSQDKLIRYL